jgi:fructosamine-3-kinase
MLKPLIGEPIRKLQAIEGGDIAETRKITTSSGRIFFVKFGDDLPTGMFTAEAAGLRALSKGGCSVPEVIAAQEGVLVLQWVEEGVKSNAYWQALGHGLAAQHKITNATYGFANGDNFIGKTPQHNPESSDWVAFFRDHRIGALQLLLRESGALEVRDDTLLDWLRGRLGDWLTLPEEKPALLHGDLWSGNTMPGPDGEPVIFDPAVHFGCREADLAMTQLFGGFSAAFYPAYRESFPLAPGYAERVPLYNLYHLMNHALLFGGGYLGQVMKIVRSFISR